MYPVLRRWISQCIICQMEGHKPEMPAEIHLGAAAYNLRRLFRPLALNELQMCATGRAAFNRA